MTESSAPQSKQLLNVHEVTLDLRKRVAQLRRDHVVIQVLIGLIMLAGFIIIGSGGSIAAIETIDYLGEARQIQEKLTATESAFDSVKDAAGKKESSDPDTEKRLNEIGTRLTEARDLLRHLPETLPEVKAVAEADRQRVALSAVVIRVTTGIVLGFLVKVLVNLYRYNAKLASFYEARADALVLAGHADFSLLDKTAKLLFPDRIDVDPIPDSPTKQVVEILKQVSSVSRDEPKSPKSH